MSRTDCSAQDFVFFPAIDVLGGRCVRLYQGDYDQQTVYGDDPVSQAQAFAEAGAQWLHVVDLDAARSGDPTNRSVIAAIAAGVNIPVQTGGGVRSVDAAKALFDAGVSRVVIGTAAITNPELVETLASDYSVAVGLDARGQDVATHGWESTSGVHLLDAARRFADSGAAALVVTEIGRDGTLAGPDVDGLGAVLGAVAIPVVASGGVGSLQDVLTLAQVRVEGRALAGVIAGRAIYEGQISVAETIRALKGDQR